MVLRMPWILRTATVRSHQIHVCAINQVSILNVQRGAETFGDFFALLGRLARREHDLEFDKPAQSLDLVEVDARVRVPSVRKEKPAPLAQFAGDAERLGQR